MKRVLCFSVYCSADAVRSAGIHVHVGDHLRRRLHRGHRQRHGHSGTQRSLLERREDQRQRLQF